MIGGGDAKLLFSVLAWQPAVDTWAITLACLALIGGAVVAWSRFRGRSRRENSIRRYPLGGVIAAAGLIVLWVPQ
jgi:Flp pilus assembly protein protease CpaA